MKLPTFVPWHECIGKTVKAAFIGPDDPESFGRAADAFMLFDDDTYTFVIGASCQGEDGLFNTEPAIFGDALEGWVKTCEEQIAANNKTRQVIAKVIRPGGQISWRECLTVNRLTHRVVAHHVFGGIADEGPDGVPFKEIFIDVDKVVFTGRMERFRNGDEKHEVVEIHVTSPWQSGDDDFRGFETTINQD